MREMSWTLTQKLDCHLRVQRDQEEGGELDPQVSPGEIKSKKVELGSESWTCLLLQFFLNSSATDIVFVTLLKRQLRNTLAASQW